MAEAIRIDFRIGDASSLNRAVTSVVQNATRTATAEARKAAQARVREEKQASQTIAREQANAAKAAAKEKANAERAAIKDRLNAEKAAAKDVATFQREMDRSSARAFKERLREQDRAQKESQRQHRAEALAAERVARASSGAIGDTRRAGLSGAGRGFMRGAGIVGGVAALAAGGIGISMASDAVRSQLDLGERSALLQNSSGRSIDFAKMSKSISNEVGVDASQVLGGFEKIAGKSGGEGIDQVKDKFLELSKVARGAGVNMTDLGDVVATLVNRGVKADDLVGVVEKLVQQGKDGAVEFKDLATMLDASSGALGRFKMGTGDRISTAGGLSQIARTYGKKSAEEATNSVEDLARDLGGKADIVQALTGGKVVGTKTIGGAKHKVLGGGVEVGTDDTRAQLRDVNTLLPEIIMGAIAKGNAGKLMGEGGIFTGNSTAIVAPLIQAATMGITKNASGRYGITGEGEKADLRGADAIKAMLAQFNGATAEAGGSAKAFANVMKSDGAQLAAATNRLKNEMGDKLAPVIAANIPNFIKLGNAALQVVSFVGENPKAAAASLVALTTAAGAAQGVVGKLADVAMDKLFKATGVMNVTAGAVNVGGAPGLSPGAAAPGALALGGAAAAGLATAGAVGGAFVMGVGDIASRDQGTGSMAAEGRALAANIAAGKGTPAEMKRAAEIKAQLEGDKGASGVLGRGGEGVLAGGKSLLSGEAGFDMKTLGNVASLIPQVAAIRGVVNAVGGSDTAKSMAGGDGGKGSDLAIAEIGKALDRPTTLAPGQEIAITGMGELIAAVTAANANSPKAQPPP